MKVQGEVPPPRGIIFLFIKANHCSSLIGNKLYIFGGWDG